MMHVEERSELIRIRAMTLITVYTLATLKSEDLLET